MNGLYTNIRQTSGQVRALTKINIEALTDTQIHCACIWWGPAWDHCLVKPKGCNLGWDWQKLNRCTTFTINVCFLPGFLKFSVACYRDQAQTMHYLKDGSFRVCSECVVPSYRIIKVQQITYFVITANFILWISVSYHKADRHQYNFWDMS